MAELESPKTESQSQAASESTRQVSEVSTRTQKSGEIDLHGSDCLCSEQLRDIRDSFIRSLPDSETLTQYSNSLLSMAGLKEPKEEKEVSLLSSITSTALDYLGLSSLAETVVSSAADLVQSAASLKELLDDPTASQEAIKAARTSLDEYKTSFETKHKELSEQSPDEAARLQPQLQQLLEQLENERKAQRLAHRNIHEQEELLESCPGVSEGCRRSIAEVHRHSLEHLLELEEERDQCLLGLKSLTENGATAEEQERYIDAEMKKSAKRTEDIEHDVHENDERVMKIAVGSGNTLLIDRLQQLRIATHAALRSISEQSHQNLSNWERALKNGWQTGLTLEHYINNTGSIFAAFANHYDLAFLRQSKVPPVPHDHNSVYKQQSVQEIEAEQKKSFVIEGSFNFNKISEKILSGSFELDSQRQRARSDTNQAEVQRYEKVRQETAMTDLNGSLSASDRLKTLLNKFFNS